MFSDMTSDHPETSGETSQSVLFHRVGENLYRLATTGGYYGLVKRGGKQFRRSLRTKDRKLAERRLAELRDKVANLALTEDSRLPFEEIAKRWISVCQHRLKPSSILRRQTCIKALTPYFKGISVRNITKGHCEAWLTGRGATIAAQTFAHELDALKGILGYALERGLILSNPAQGIKRKRIVQARIQIPTRAEFQKLLVAMRHSDGRPDSQAKARPGADLIELMAYSGMRVGEATALTWADVDFEKSLLTVRGGEDGTKNHEERVVPMTQALKALLVRMRADRGNPDPGALVSTIKDAKTQLRKTCVRLGLAGFTHHDFRHFFATTCIEAGVDIPTISRWLGHKDGGALAMRVYGHLREDHSRSQIQRVSFDTPSNVVALSEPVRPKEQPAIATS